MAGNNCCIDLWVREWKGTLLLFYKFISNTNRYNISSVDTIMYCTGTLWFYFGTCLNRSQKWLKEILKACWFFWKRIQVIYIFMKAKVEECSLFHRQHEITIFVTYFILQSIPGEHILFLMNFQIINLQSFQFCINILEMLVVQPH